MLNIPERALIIRKPWSNHILEGSKTWELRGKNTKIRGPIALIEGGSGTIVGMFTLEDTQGPLTRDERLEAANQGQILREEVDEDMYENVYAWKIKDVVKFNIPIEYKHPSGAVIWVTMTDSDKENIKNILNTSSQSKRMRMR